MRIGLTADWHIGIARFSKMVDSIPSKTLDSIAGVEKIIEDMKSKDVEVMVVAGDLSHIASPPPYVFNHLSRLLNKASENFKSVIVLNGNHDPCNSATGVGVVGVLSKMVNSNVKCFEGRNDSILIDGVNFLICPYINATNTLKFGIVPSARNVVVAHHQFAGARSGSESYFMSGGVAEIPHLEHVELVLSGHIHAQQAFKMTNGVTVLYPGSPARFDFGERHEDKGWICVDIPKEGDIIANLYQIQVRPMIQVAVENEWLTDERKVYDELTKQGIVAGAEIKPIIYTKPCVAADVASFKRVMKKFDPYFVMEPKVIVNGQTEQRKSKLERGSDPYLIKQSYIDTYINSLSQERSSLEIDEIKKIAYQIIGKL